MTFPEIRIKPEEFKTLYVNQLRSMYASKTTVHRALPRLVEMVAAAEFSTILLVLRKETGQHLDRLITLLLDVGELPDDQPCTVTLGLIALWEQKLQEGGLEQGGKDATLVGLTKCIEYHNLAQCDSLVTYARILDHSRHIHDLRMIELEQRKTISRLTMLVEQPPLISA